MLKNNPFLADFTPSQYALQTPDLGGKVGENRGFFAVFRCFSGFLLFFRYFFHFFVNLITERIAIFTTEAAGGTPPPSPHNPTVYALQTARKGPSKP